MNIHELLQLAQEPPLTLTPELGFLKCFPKFFLCLLSEGEGGKVYLGLFASCSFKYLLLVRAFGFLFSFFFCLFLRIQIKSILLLPLLSSIIGSFCFLPLCSLFFSLCLLWSVSVREVLKEQRYNRPSGSWEGLN